MVRTAWNFVGSEPHSGESDAELVARFQAGDESAFDALFHRYNQPLCNYLTALTGDVDIACHLAQDAFVKVYRQLPQDVKHFKAWLYRVGYNAAIDHMRKRWWTTRLSDCAEDAACIEGPERGVERAELVRIAMRSIPEKYRAPLYLYHVEEMTQAEIALYLRIGERSVRRYIMEGMKKLTQVYERLEHEYDTPEGGSSHE